jgi:outer membrane protein OmpA-like peptidoglycan-associated protein/Tol biopolymer transport system component
MIRIFFIGLFFSAFCLYGQGNLSQKMEMAEKSFNQMKYDETRLQIQEILSKNEKFAMAYRLLGLLELRVKRYEESTIAFEKLFQIKPDFSRCAYYEAAESYMKLYQYEKALDYFFLYKNALARDFKISEDNAVLRYDKFIDRNINNCQFSIEMGFHGKGDQPFLLGGNINSSMDESMPSFTPDATALIFTSNRQGDENLYHSKSVQKGWSDAKSVGGVINSLHNEGMAKFSTCGSKIYFSSCNWENVRGGCDIYQASYDIFDEIVDGVEPVDFLNSEFWESQPSISCDGSAIYFASNRAGGYGGTDIYCVYRTKQGNWGKIQNLGPEINTAGDEESPFISLDGKTLYFASDGHPGMGEQDIFVSYLQENQIFWTSPVNLGESVNSPYRETGLVLHPNHESVYFSSDRQGGKGGLDLYQNQLSTVLKPKYEHLMIRGHVFNAENKSAIESATVKVRMGDKELIYNLTDINGLFMLCVPVDSTFSYVISKKGFESFIGADYYEKSEANSLRSMNIYLNPEGRVVTLNEGSKDLPKRNPRKNLSVYFESDQHSLVDEQIRQIHKLLDPYLEDENVKLVVTGFADDDGDQNYNLNLSKKRAEEVKKVMMNLGIKESSILYDGKGVVESNLAKHQKRRVEIVILQ